MDPCFCTSELHVYLLALQVQLWDLRKAGSNTLTLGGSGAGQQQIITSIAVVQKAQELLHQQQQQQQQGMGKGTGSAKLSSDTSSSSLSSSRVFGTDISNGAGRGGEVALPYFQEIKSHPMDPNLLAFITSDNKVSVVSS